MPPLELAPERVALPEVADRPSEEVADLLPAVPEEAANRTAVDRVTARWYDDLPANDLASAGPVLTIVAARGQRRTRRGTCGLLDLSDGFPAGCAGGQTARPVARASGSLRRFAMDLGGVVCDGRPVRGRRTGRPWEVVRYLFASRLLSACGDTAAESSHHAAAGSRRQVAA